MKKILILLTALLSSACMKITSQGKAPLKPKILVTVEPYAEMVEQIAGSKVNVVCVIPPGVDPHNWEPTIKDMNRIQDGIIWFTIGEGSEHKLLNKLKEVNENLAEINLASSVDVISSSCCHADEESYDTHLWLSPKADITQAKVILESLTHLLPEETTFFSKNYTTLETKLKKWMIDFEKAWNLIKERSW